VTEPLPKPLLGGIIAAAVVFGCVVFAVFHLTGKKERATLPAFSELSDFTLKESSGRDFQLQDLLGNVWIADFIFTRCGGPCPMMSAHMQTLQGKIHHPDVKFVSFSVDPEHDTPEVLKKYAERFGADRLRWFFLTGSKKKIHAMARGEFLLATDEEKDQPPETLMLHSTKFVLVDRSGSIRGYYDSTDAEALKKLEGDVKILLGS